MTQSFIQPKGSLNTQVNTSGLQNQLAQMFANQQLQNQAQQTATSGNDPLREIVTNMVKNNLLENVEVPKEYTIADALKSNFAPNTSMADKIQNIANYFGSPDGQRNLGNLFGTQRFNPETKMMESTGDRLYREEYQKLREEQQRALNLQKEQNKLAEEMAKAYNQRDIADENNKRMRELAEQEMKWKREEAALDRALRREAMSNDLERARIIHGAMSGGSAGGSATGGAAGVNDLKMTAAERKQYTEGKTTLANIEAGLKALEENPKAYTFAKGLLPADITNRLDPAGVATRSQIDNITAVYRKWLTGAQMSDKERKAYERFLPAPTDNYNIVKAKLNGMKGAIERSNDAILSNYGVSSASMSTPSLNVDRNSLEAEMKRRGLK